MAKVIGMATIADATDKGEPGSEITVEDLQPYQESITRTGRVLIRTGWSRNFGQDAFFDNFPGISPAAAKWLVERGVKMVGIEQPSVHPVEHLQVHKTLLSSGAILVESVANLDMVTQDEVLVICLPLRLKGRDGSPARLVAVEDAELTGR